MTWKIIEGHVLDRLRRLKTESVNCVVTSPPYWGLRDYETEPVKWAGGWEGHLGLEPTPELYVKHIIGVFRRIRRVLRDDGTLWLVLGDSYVCRPNGQIGASTLEGSKEAQRRYRRAIRKKTTKKPKGAKYKDLVGIPWRVALALQNDGWFLRSDIVWSKPNPMPESVKDRPTRSHEYIFLLSKSDRYYYDNGAIREPLSIIRKSVFAHGKKSRDRRYSGREYDAKDLQGRNKRSVWTVATEPYPEAHFATFPAELIEPCVLAGCPPDGVVLDPFAGSGTVGEVCVLTGRRFVGIELSPDYCKLARRRIVAARERIAAATMDDAKLVEGEVQLGLLP